MAITVNRAVLAHRLFKGVSRRHLACLVEELAVPWRAGLKGLRHAARGGARRRAAGAGARHQLVFADRLVATQIPLRHDLPHSVLGLLSGVDRTIITRAIAAVRTLLVERGCAVPDRPDLRLRTLTDVFAYAQAEGVELRLDATEIQVRRPPAGCGGRRAFVSGKKKQNTMKASVIADRVAARPGPMPCAWATARRHGRPQRRHRHLLPAIPRCRGPHGRRLSRPEPRPPRPSSHTSQKPRPEALPGTIEQWERDRHWHSSGGVTVEHSLADHKRRKQLMRRTHRRDRLPDTYRAIANLVSDRTAPHRPSLSSGPQTDRTSTPHPLSRTNS